MKLHLLGLPHTVTSLVYSHCAFTGKVLRFAPMMMSAGYEVIHYGNQGAESGATEQVEVLTTDEMLDLMAKVENRSRMRQVQQRKTKVFVPVKPEDMVYKPNQQDFVGNMTDVGNELYRTFNKKLQPLLKERVEGDDLICLPFGHAHQQAVNGLPGAHVETGIGYPVTFARFKIYETYAWYHWHLGRANQGKGQGGDDYNWVIPNYFDLTHWTPRSETGEYVLYFGRLGDIKGLRVFVEMARYRPDLEFIMCGQGDPAPYLAESENITYKEPIHGLERDALVGGALAMVVPTRYVEPFGGVAVEAMLCGTPVITSDFGAFTETVTQGVTGFRCHTLGDYLAALEMVEYLDRAVISAQARERWDMFVVAQQYAAAFQQIADLWDQGWYALRSNLGPIAKAVVPPPKEQPVGPLNPVDTVRSLLKGRPAAGR